MARSVLLVEPDVDVLGEMASRLRPLGLTVALASEAADLAERARSARAEVLLLSDSLPDLAVLLRAMDGDPTLAGLPRVVLTRGESGVPFEGTETLRHDDYDGVAQRVHALQGRPAPAASLRDDFRGELVQVSVIDLIQLLNMNRRTGVLAVTTATGSGEVHFDDGEIVDACYRRLESEKALLRLLAEREGTFAFTSTGGGAPRRIETPTRALLMDGVRELDEVRRWRDSLGLADEVLVTSVRPGPNDPEAEGVTLRTLVVPRTVDELLDEVTLSDQAALEALRQLLDDGRVRRLPRGAARVPLASAEQLPVLAAVAARLTAAGFDGPSRIALAGAPRRLATLAHTLLRITDAQPPTEAPPSLPIPHDLGTIGLGESAELKLVALPLVAAYAPLWTLALAGTAAVIRLAEPMGAGLEETCSVLGIPLLDAPALVGDLDEADPAQLASLVRSALDSLAGE